MHQSRVSCASHSRATSVSGSFTQSVTAVEAGLRALFAISLNPQALLRVFTEVELAGGADAFQSGQPEFVCLRKALAGGLVLPPRARVIQGK